MTTEPGLHAGRADERVPTTAAVLERAVEHLLALQTDEGWWQGELRTNVTIDAEDLLMRQFLGIRTGAQTAATARWVRTEQRADGSWATFPGGPADLSTTVEAYLALRLAGDRPDEPHMARAREVVLRLGGLDRTRVFTRIWLALFGLWPWEQVPAVPAELVLLPRWMPFNVYDFACWARQTIVPISILASLRPRRDLGITVEELRRAGRAPEPAAAPGGPGPCRLPWRALFQTLDRGLHLAERSPWKPLRPMALRAATRWVVDRQEADGSWGGIQPPWVYSLMALSALGWPTDHPVISRGLTGWDRFTVVEDTPQGPVRRIEACQSPVWDTVLALTALGDAGMDVSHPAVRRAVDWVVGQEIRAPGDWAVKRRHAPAGGWAFEFDNDGYPDIDDTAEVVLALDRVGATRFPGPAAAVDRGIGWLLGLQCSDGGWAAFDADNDRELAYQLPFCDFGAVIDPPSADVTAHVLEMLAARGLSTSRAARRGVTWLLEHQEADGSWFGRWGCNHVYGTGAVVPALVAAGLPSSSPAIRRAVGWLTEHQAADGGWGEDLRSYTDPGHRGRGEPTPSQTAWALLALHAADEGRSEAARAGLAWLARTQRDDGGWDEPQFTGTGFPGAFYIGYHLYRLVFPVSALARCLQGES